MGINEYRQNGIARKLDNYADDLQYFRDKIVELGEEVEVYWQGEEADTIRAVIEKLVIRVGCLAKNAEDIAQDIYDNVDDIQREERERAEQQMIGMRKKMKNNNLIKQEVMGYNVVSKIGAGAYGSVYLAMKEE